MNAASQMKILKSTFKGDVRIHSFCKPDEIQLYHLNHQFGTYAHYKSLYSKRESLEKKAEDPDANVTLVLKGEKEIIGFGVLAYPVTGERWTKLEPKIMMEVKALEICRDWRSTGLAKAIIRILLLHPQIEDKIVYMVGYSWTWDLDGTQKTAHDYRKMLIQIFEPFGFLEYQTNEPNISLRPENVFMGRVGKNVSQAVQNSFKWIRFGIYSE
jgi:acetoin utilization protein AcuA